MPPKVKVDVITSRSTLGRQLRYYRQVNGYTQKQLAKLVGIDRRLITMYENYKSKEFNHIKILKKIIDFLGIEDKLNLPEYIKFAIDNPSERLKTFQKKRGLTIADLSKQLKCDRHQIMKWRNGTAIMSNKYYSKIKNGLYDEKVKVMSQ